MLGAGSWGTALSLVLADNGHQVMMWGHRAELIDQINELHENKDYLPGWSYQVLSSVQLI